MILTFQQNKTKYLIHEDSCISYLQLHNASPSLWHLHLPQPDLQPHLVSCSQLLAFSFAHQTFPIPSQSCRKKILNLFEELNRVKVSFYLLLPTVMGCNIYPFPVLNTLCAALWHVSAVLPGSFNFTFSSNCFYQFSFLRVGCQRECIGTNMQ